MLRHVALAATLAQTAAMGGGGGGQTCPASAPFFTGNPTYEGNTPIGAPLRGNIGCIDETPLARRPTAGNGNQNAVNIYGPMEAGFTSQQWSCLGDRTIPGGIDTLLAEHMLHFMCSDDSLQIMDFCGGHATPYHYHERMTCLYEGAENGHSTRVGTALDGRGIYGSNIAGGVPPTDLDVCNGRVGVTPDSGGEEVYYYVITEEAPFTAGCFGPVASVEECRALEPNCGNGNTYQVETQWGVGDYDLDCPCFDELGSNIPGVGRPGFLEPLSSDKQKHNGAIVNSPAPAPGDAPAADSGWAAVAVLAVGGGAMAGTVVTRVYSGKEREYMLPSLSNLWTERSYSQVAASEAEADALP